MPKARIRTSPGHLIGRRTRGIISPICLFAAPILLWACCAFSPPLHAQEKPGDIEAAKKSRPRIGLALSGGGARGIAHVGVLKVLEAQRVPIDCIAGTSMGAIVGGMYASGMSPEAIEKNLLKIDWNLLLTDSPPRKDVPIRLKGDDSLALFNQEFGVRSGHLVPPGGLVAGQNLQIVLEGLTIRAADVRDFDKLRIPFRAVATDIGRCEKVVIGKGRLSDALRASMSIPGVFAPVDLEGRRLVDGGLVDNLPVDVARSMGADVVIAVDIATPYLEPDQVDSLVKIFEQTLRMLTHVNTEANKVSADVLLRPDLQEFTGQDYKLSPEIIRRGEMEATARLALLTPYSLSAEDYASYKAGHTREPYRLGEIGFVRYESGGHAGPGHVDERQVVSRMKSQEGKTPNLHNLQEDITRIYALGEFERVTFEPAEENGRQGLLIKSKEKPWGPNYFRLGLALQSDFEGASYFSLLAKYNRTRVNRLGADFKITAEIGRPRRLSAEFYQPLDFPGHVFVAPAMDLSWVPQYVYDGSRRMTDYELATYLAGLDFGITLGRYGELRLGPRWGYRTTDVKVGLRDLPRTDDRVFAYSGRFVLDQLDRYSFPQKGFYAQVQGFMARDQWGSDVSYDKLWGTWRSYHTFGKNTVLLHLSGGSSLESTLPYYDVFRLGGFSGLSGYADQAIQGDSFALARLGYRRRIHTLPVMLGEGGVFFCLWGEAGNAWAPGAPRTWESLRYSGTLALGADTNLGPFYIAVSKAGGEDFRFYLSLGKSF